MARPPLPLVLVAASFAAITGWLLVTSVTPRTVATFAPDTTRRIHWSHVPDTVTIDASDPDRWQFFSFTEGRLGPTERPAWDLAFRRFRVVPAREVARLDGATFDSLRRAPDSGYVATELGTDTLNRAMARWYRYSMLSHLLRPNASVYVVRTRSGEAAKLEVLSYYCPGPTPGCVTIRFARLPRGLD